MLLYFPGDLALGSGVPGHQRVSGSGVGCWTSQTSARAERNLTLSVETRAAILSQPCHLIPSLLPDWPLPPRLWLLLSAPFSLPCRQFVFVLYVCFRLHCMQDYMCEIQPMYVYMLMTSFHRREAEGPHGDRGALNHSLGTGDSTCGPSQACSPFLSASQVHPAPSRGLSGHSQRASP